MVANKKQLTEAKPKRAKKLTAKEQYEQDRQKAPVALTLNAERGQIYEIRLVGLVQGSLHVAIQGISPLLVHRFSTKARLQIKEAQTTTGKAKTKKQRDPKDPWAEFNGARYLIDGADCIPAIMVKKAMTTAAIMMDGLTGADVRRSVFIRGDAGNGAYLTLSGDEAPEGEGDGIAFFREDYVRIGGMNKTTDLRWRPEYRNWSCEFQLEWNERVITMEQVLNLVHLAGFACGLGEWRPSSAAGGEMGRFKLDLDFIAKANQ